MHKIQLSSADDIVTVCDRLQWVQGDPRVLLVLPVDDDRLLTEWLDLVRLRRCAERLRLEVGLVTTNSAVRSQARDLGFATFHSEQSAEKGRRGWWRDRRGWHRPTRPGATVRLGEGTALKSLPDEADRREMYRRMTPSPTWGRWVRRYFGIFLFFMTLALFTVGVAYAVPGATIELRPEVETVRVSRQIVADPQLETVNHSGASVPGRLLAVTQRWQAEAATTGSVDVPDAPARGTVVFVNRIEEPVTVPAGTRVTTSGGTRVAFQTTEAVEVPGAAGGTSEAPIVAVEPGPEGNVGPNQVNRIEGSLALQLDVRNLEATEGGGVRSAPSVARADQERLRAQVLQQLQTLAAAEMEERLAENEFLARDSLRVVQIHEETYSHFPGERTERLALEIRAEIHGTAVDASQANDLVYEELANAVAQGYELVPDSITFYSDEVLGVDEQGRVTFMQVGEARMAAALDLSEPVARIAGQETGLAVAYLYETLPLQDYPAVRIWPNWFDRLPYLPARIRAEVITGG
ncbi:MAG: baseplate J/gp47 family protein [Chloroflexota bacterium]